MSYASVLTRYGGPEVLEWREVPLPAPGPGQVRIAVRAAGVGPTDLKIRRGDLQAVFPLPEPAVLGFEAAGVVDALGVGVEGVEVGDEVAAWLPRLGGYGEHVLATSWTAKAAAVGWEDAAALPASAEAAVGVLRQLGIEAAETLLVLGGAGTVGVIATQLAVRQGVTVLAAVGPADDAATEALGARAVRYGDALEDAVRATTDHVDAVFDAAGRGGLPTAIALAGGTERVITIADKHARDLGVRLSAPTPDRAPDGVSLAMDLLAAGELRLRRRRTLPMREAAEAHRILECGETTAKLVLTTG